MMLSLATIYAELRIACEGAGGQDAWARRHDLSPQYVSDVLNARRDPGPKLLTALGMRKVISYVRSYRT
jgi:DNA-binding transcriptional regulator YdaS (Cro superfamily)